eukprot:3401-Heterococcus_DN1.PRE.1
MKTTCTRHHITFDFVAKASMRPPARRCSRHHSNANSMHMALLPVAYSSSVWPHKAEGHTATSAAANQQAHVNINNYAESMYTQCVLTLKGYAQAHAIPHS